MAHSSGYLKWVKSQLLVQLSKIATGAMELTTQKGKEEICEDLKVKKIWKDLGREKLLCATASGNRRQRCCHQPGCS